MHKEANLTNLLTQIYIHRRIFGSVFLVINNQYGIVYER